jgi:glutathione synthase/RimK-type ligase-like ATP-grasp enzyme
MKRLALATSSKHADLTSDDRLLLAPLADRGFHAEPAVWTDTTYPWCSCAAVVIRSCWDYHVLPLEFTRWIGDLESSGVMVFNSPQHIRWNTDKCYLRELERDATSIVPTVWPHGDEALNLKDLLQQMDWRQAVVKPRISATAYRTQVVDIQNANVVQPLFDDLRRGTGVMVQKFMENIASDGEWSVIFFAGTFSHAVLKHPKPGDFRVQNDFGGKAKSCNPPGHVLESAIRLLRGIGPTVYARVDGVLDGDQFRLMELELIEPALFLGEHPEAPVRFADAIVQAVTAGSPQIISK